MLDINTIRQHPEEIISMLHNRQLASEEPKIEQLLNLDRERKGLVQRSDDLKALRNKVSKEIAEIKKSGIGSSGELILQMKSVSEEIAGMDTSLGHLEEEIETILLGLPNKLHPSVPVGRSADDNQIFKEPISFPYHLDFPLKNHLELGKSLRILDFERGAKVCGAGFPVYIGKGARLERALINFMLDCHTERHGYTEVFPPFFVNQESLRGTGQWPKFADQVYHMEEDDLYAIPTAEVPITNLHRGEMLDTKTLPISYAAYSACFRREAGSYGKDTRGFLRVHQFNKVEMVKFTRPEESYEALETIRENAEAILTALKIPYRVLLLCSGDISANATKCYDIEVWSPAEQKYLEASSCSNFEDYQARRANIRFKSESNAKPEFVHTLNGSGLATSRLMVSLLEHYQTAEGSIMVPEVLRHYTRFDEITQAAE
ncbi:serine--tRNA ligase [Pelodictyon phaeoclathratiforme]|jgi:seryl-tRNA synthetase|uniref:Serine--tRNA ligase n=1 Tax=Pelodictyon phaeoclathratiforme (strain DSM 5477 / BU-1) TaxID=324925 RepID=SYS_PELPB|nr:serine--tRNA ligase [Pelodictyon phaeoclathratiforme]B4SF71.1 RecName: Full=Serine--tRNA ligase; AltName: Full=Seryl-tRNA synthetase; Short=SerRS; AltName: Full=Seryl-tRNA(Ser/Sec) synthetase [Pelodictyon phaeoclathratiforme BU-1]ACF43218.1 seryl-tRNA synthetase [Pelodictyon phaeoclathratiforme BU-1]MBV5290062.1 serine--tRNA ligase [Pelodictyon phaeoclathratiforme]